MIKIYIQGLKDGEYQIDTSCLASEIPEIFPEFSGEVKFTGKMKVLGKRIYIEGKAICNADLICDRTLTEFKKQIEAEIKIDYLLRSYGVRHKEEGDEEERIISEDSKYIDITEEIREELAVNLPMKRVAPEYEDKEFDEIFSEYTIKENPSLANQVSVIDERWAPLKNLKIN